MKTRSARFGWVTVATVELQKYPFNYSVLSRPSSHLCSPFARRLPSLLSALLCPLRKSLCSVFFLRLPFLLPLLLLSFCLSACLWLFGRGFGYRYFCFQCSISFGLINLGFVDLFVLFDFCSFGLWFVFWVMIFLCVLWVDFSWVWVGYDFSVLWVDFSWVWVVLISLFFG